MYSDIKPFEVIKEISPKTIEIRAMKAKELPWKKDFRVGGFCGTMVNQQDQEWEITSDETAPIIRARLGKRGWKSDLGIHILSDKPIYFYDYNF
jgi:hypothetical protein